MSLHLQDQRTKWTGAAERSTQKPRELVLESSLLLERVSVTLRIHSALRVKCAAAEVRLLQEGN